MATCEMVTLAELVSESRHEAVLVPDETSEKDGGGDGEEEVAALVAAYAQACSWLGSGAELLSCKGQSQCRQKSAMFRKGALALKRPQHAPADVRPLVACFHLSIALFLLWRVIRFSG